MISLDNNKYMRAFSLYKLNFIIESKNKELINNDEFFLGKGEHLHSLLSNFNHLQEIDPPNYPDVIFRLRDSNATAVSFTQKGDNTFELAGPLVKNETHAKDKRVCIFGNMGFFSKFLVRELEKKGIFSIHSTSFFDPKNKRLFLVIGGSGSGKSTVLLKAISIGGIEVFGTEITHFSTGSSDIKMIKGSMWQNCRMGNLVFDFPELLEKFGLTSIEGDLWHMYKSVPLHNLQTPESDFERLKIVILMPRIEGERNTISINKVAKSTILFNLFQNMSDKVSPPTLLWGNHFLPSIDSSVLQIVRMSSAEKFLASAQIESCWNILASPGRCLEGLYPNPCRDSTQNKNSFIGEII